MSTWEFVTSTKCVSPTAPWVSGGRQVPQAVAWSTPSILSTTVEGGARTAAAASAWVSPDLVGAVVSVVTAFSISHTACPAVLAGCHEETDSRTGTSGHAALITHRPKPYDQLAQKPRIERRTRSCTRLARWLLFSWWPAAPPTSPEAMEALRL